MSEKKSFVVYFDYRQHLELLTPEEQGQLFMALFDYGETGNEPELEGAARMAFSFIKAQMDRDTAKYKETCRKRKEAGKQGGRPSKAKEESEKQTKAKKANGFSEKQMKAKKADTDNDTDNDNENDTDTVTDNDIGSRAKSKRFTPPTLEEVKDYCWERMNNVDAQRFIDFYESKGWMVGKNKMKDWKAAVRNWERTEQSSVPRPPNQNKEGRLDWIDDV